MNERLEGFVTQLRNRKQLNMSKSLPANFTTTREEETHCKQLSQFVAGTARGKFQLARNNILPSAATLVRKAIALKTLISSATSRREKDDAELGLDRL